MKYIPNVALERAKENYLEESRLATQMLDHAGRLRYPQYRAQLEAVAREESHHAGLLEGWLTRQGASVPAQEPQLKDGRNDWERLRCDYEDDRFLAEKYLRDAFAVDHLAPDLALLFREIRETERPHREILLHLVMRHDCYDS